MKAEIDKYGYLFIERAGEMKKQCCPFNDLGDCYCGDWCPLFDEPMERSIAICHKIIYFKEFRDLRNKEETS